MQICHITSLSPVMNEILFLQINKHMYYVVQVLLSLLRHIYPKKLHQNAETNYFENHI